MNKKYYLRTLLEKLKILWWVLLSSIISTTVLIINYPYTTEFTFETISLLFLSVILFLLTISLWILFFFLLIFMD
jgi:hypothetical protein